MFDCACLGEEGHRATIAALVIREQADPHVVRPHVALKRGVQFGVEVFLKRATESPRSGVFAGDEVERRK